MALQTYPQVRHVMVVSGTSDFDRGWENIVRADLRSFEKRLSVNVVSDLPLDELLRDVSALPPDTVILFVSMTRDGAGYPAQPRQVTQLLRAASPVPIYGLSTTYLRYGIVGGALLDFDRHAADLGREAVRMLNGGGRQVFTTPATTAVDWRELQRFHIPESALPTGTVIVERQYTIWQRYKGSISLVALAFLGQSALIVALVRANRRRREAQRMTHDRLRFERLVTDLAIRLTAADPYQIDTVLETALTQMAAGIGVDKVWRWEFGAPVDEAWDSAPLRTGRAAMLMGVEGLPPSIQEGVKAAGCLSCWTVAVALLGDRLPLGALFWVSHLPHAQWLASPDELQIVSGVVSNVLQRRGAERAAEQSDRFKGAILDSLTPHVAVLDREGTILAVNSEWMKFGLANGAPSAEAIGPGVNYLDACVEGVRAGISGAEKAVSLIHAACRGERTVEPLEYLCDSPGEERWFAMRAEPLLRPEGGAVVTHTDVTQRKKNEIALRESEGRFRRLADALPIAIWMSDTSAACNYFNQRWLDMTGRTLEQEVGEGWLEGVHPDDRSRCLDTYLTAFQARERFTMEYRIRHRDGVYRWLMDVGLPRYGTDGEFHGYVGGCVDIHARIEAEQMLRNLNRRLIAAQEDERRRIARELHDHLNQQLALLAIELQQLSMNPPRAPEALAEALQQEWRRTSEIASDVHAISHKLHPSKLEALGLVATIRAHCRDVARQGMTVHFSERDVPATVLMDVALCLYRVLQEALTNVAKHSGTKEAEVTLFGGDSGLTLRVSDQGRGLPRGETHSSGIGLVSMRERLQMLGGTLSIASAPGRGTTVEASVPVAVSAATSPEPVEQT
jgi:PAS domain S-box-containing protein